MRRLAALALVGLSACSSGNRGEAPSASVPVPSSDGGLIDGGMSDGGPGEGGLPDGGAASLELFLEAARTNLERPYPVGQPSSEQRYAEAAAALSPTEARRIGAGFGAASVVARVLASSKDPRAAEALVAWAASPAARPYLADILGWMHGYPREAWLDTARAVLADPANAGVIVHLHVDGGLLREALDMSVRSSLHVMAIELAAALPGPAGKDLVREIARDRGRSAPDSRTLEALKCGEGETRVEAEAQALSSLRVMALATLRDRELLKSVAADPTEPALVRQWAARMLAGGPDKSKPGWEKRLDARQKQAHEQSMLEFVPFAVAPCFTAKPRPIIPSEGAPRGPARGP